MRLKTQWTQQKYPELMQDGLGICIVWCSGSVWLQGNPLGHPWELCQRLQCHIALVTFGCPAEGRAVLQHKARQSVLVLHWLHPEGPGLLGVGGPRQWPIVPASSASLTSSPTFPPCLFYKQAFQENSALQGVVPSDMLSELCCPG